MVQRYRLTLFFLLVQITTSSNATIQCTQGHYRPQGSCHIQNAIVLPNATILTTSFTSNPITQSVSELYNIQATAPTTLPTTTCNHLQGPVIAFTFYYHYNLGNYYHFVYDTLIPLISLMKQHKGWLENKHIDAELWPTVEHGSLPGMQPGVDWDTNAFDRLKLPYWQTSLIALFPNFKLRPMTRKHWPSISSSSSSSRSTFTTGIQTTPLNLCIQDLVLGLPKTIHKDPTVIDQYVTHVRNRFNLASPFSIQESTGSIEPRGSIAPSTGTATTLAATQCNTVHAGFIRRSNRRRVINYQAIVDIMALDVSVDVLHLETMTMRQQIEKMNTFSILVGMQGAGFINGMFLSTFAHVIVLFQYNAASDSFAELLRPRVQSYQRWMNYNESASVNDKLKDPYHDIADTIVDINEFQMLWKIEVDGLKEECKVRMNIKKNEQTRKVDL